MKLMAPPSRTSPSNPHVKRDDLPCLPSTEVFAALETREQGLTQAEADQRVQRYGRNIVHEVKRKPLYREFLANFTHVMALLLWVGGLIAFLTETPELGIAIWLVNLINGTFSFWQEYKAEKAIEALREMLPSYARVVREGQERRILAAELVPGDVILLSEGDRLSADARLVQAADLRLDQSTLTGESRPVSKTSRPLERRSLAFTESPNLAFAGTCVVSGNGRAVVFGTGMASEFGKIAHLTQSLGEEPNPLQREIQRLTATITRICLSIAVVFFWLIHLSLGLNLAQSFMIALGMLIAFVPEGLLPTLTLSLAIGVQRMAKRNALIKRLSSVEALGRTTVICTDKTGTLTENQMTVNVVWLPETPLSVTGSGYAPEGEIRSPQGPPTGPAVADLRQLLVAAGLCNDAHLVPPHTENPRWSALGDPTEASLLVLARKGGVDLATERRAAPRLHELAFNSYRKRMSTVHRYDGGRIAFTKGAPKEVLALCSTLRSNGVDQPLEEALRAQVMAANDAYARQGLRLLAVAMRRLPAGPDAFTPEVVERELTLLGLVAMRDPPRSDVAEAVEKCHRAGIRILMLTGDYSLTAEGIARSIGITRSEHPRLLTGSDLEAMDDAALAEAFREDVIFSRITPEQKLRVVRVLQGMGHIVAVTGDGVNDAPALRQADIGIAMGLVGTDVAKEAADMILTDDHFASIVNAVEEGRTVFENIRKFILYVFGSNMAEGVPFLVTLFSRGLVPLPITVMQTLAVDLGTDMLPAIGLGAEPPEEDIMKRPPRPQAERLLSRKVVALGLLWYGLIDSTAAMSSYFFLNWQHGWPAATLAPVGTPLYSLATTMTFAGIVAAQMGAAFACRTERCSIFKKGFFGNRLLVTGVALEVVLLLVLMYVPLFQRIFTTAPISWTDWCFVLAWAPALLFADELRKAWLRRR